MTDQKATGTTNIESILQEDRIFSPQDNFDARIGGAYIGSLDEYNTMYKRSTDDPEIGRAHV